MIKFIKNKKELREQVEGNEEYFLKKAEVAIKDGVTDLVINAHYFECETPDGYIVDIEIDSRDGAIFIYRIHEGGDGKYTTDQDCYAVITKNGETQF